MAAALPRLPPQTVGERMDALYNRCSRFCQGNSYYKCYEPATMARIFERLRNGGAYWRVAEYEIEHIRDLTTGHDSAQPGGRAVLPPPVPAR